MEAALYLMTLAALGLPIVIILRERRRTQTRLAACPAILKRPERISRPRR